MRSGDLYMPAAVNERTVLPLQELNWLAASRKRTGMPPISVVKEMPQSDEWAAVGMELPFREVNNVLGVQLDRRIM